MDADIGLGKSQQRHSTDPKKNSLVTADSDTEQQSENGDPSDNAGWGEGCWNCNAENGGHDDDADFLAVHSLASEPVGAVTETDLSDDCTDRDGSLHQVFANGRETLALEVGVVEHQRHVGDEEKIPNTSVVFFATLRSNVQCIKEETGTGETEKLELWEREDEVGTGASPLDRLQSSALWQLLIAVRRRRLGRRRGHFGCRKKGGGSKERGKESGDDLAGSFNEPRCYSGDLTVSADLSAVCSSALKNGPVPVWLGPDVGITRD